MQTTRWKETQWINITAQAHDLICKCDNPIKHFVCTVLKRQKFTNKEKQEIQQCLTGTEEDTTLEGGFSAGDLEKLFGEDDAAGEDDAR